MSYSLIIKHDKKYSQQGRNVVKTRAASEFSYIIYGEERNQMFCWEELFYTELSSILP